MNKLPSVLMIGTGEYTTGYVHNAASTSDKGAGVVALTLFDLKRRGKVSQLKMVGTNGTKFPAIREHFAQCISNRYANLDVNFESYPSNDVSCDPSAYLKALDALEPGDLATIFTPDPTHFEIAKEAVRRGVHVLLAKPLVKTLEEHLQLLQEAKKTNTLVALEVHKRWDPIYVDARDRILGLGDFSSFNSYMSQPKTQLETFKSWASGSDISYYLNAHHIDFHAWCMMGRALPRSVYATAATGVANSLGLRTEDTIALHVTWENLRSHNVGTATYTASWIAPPSDVHSQQRFFYMGQQGETAVDQAHRGFTLATDDTGFSSVNPLFMKYTPSPNGEFVGQTGYGYRSIESFVDAVTLINSAVCAPTDLSHKLALASDTLHVTAILEAGRRSLDTGKVQHIVHDTQHQPIDIRSSENG